MQPLKAEAPPVVLGACYPRTVLTVYLEQERERENKIKVRNKTGLVGSELCQFDVSIIFRYILSICLEFNSDVGRELILSSYFFAIH